MAGGAPSGRRQFPLPWLLACVGLIVLACLGGGTGATLYIIEHVPANSAQGGPSPSRSAAPPGDLAEPTPTAAPTATAPPTIPKDRKYQGRGNKIVNLSLTAGLRHTATFTHQGGSNVVVWALDLGGRPLDLVVNAIGRYSGARPLDFEQAPRALKIETNGAWTVTVRAFAKTPLWTGRSAGRAPTVLRLDPTAAPGPVRVLLTHAGDGNFIVHAYRENGTDMLVNEIGRFSDRVTIPEGAIAVSIDCVGSWTVKKV